MIFQRRPYEEYKHEAEGQDQIILQNTSNLCGSIPNGTAKLPAGVRACFNRTREGNNYLRAKLICPEDGLEVQRWTGTFDFPQLLQSPTSHYYLDCCCQVS